MSPFDLTGKTSIVIGGTSGIGRAIALALAEAGADVVPTARRPEPVARTVREIEQLGRRGLAVQADVNNRQSLEMVRDAVISTFGQIDILVNSAGMNMRKPTLDVSEDEWGAILEANLTGTFRACQVFGRRMVERGHGCIINIASVTSFVALTEVAPYGASKAGVVALTRSLAVEWAPFGVRVNAIAPGIIRTEFNKHLIDDTPRGRELVMRTPMKRFGRADEIAGAAVFLASPAAGYVTGEVIRVDGGFLASGVNQ